MAATAAARRHAASNSCPSFVTAADLRASGSPRCPPWGKSRAPGQDVRATSRFSFVNRLFQIVPQPFEYPMPDITASGASRVVHLAEQLRFAVPNPARRLGEARTI